jgi:FkbM family methyltransferase
MRQLVRAKLASLSRRAPGFKGKLRLTRALERVLGSTNGSLRSESFGASFLVEGRDLIEFWILWHGAYDRLVSEALQGEVEGRGRRCFWDVGANIGAISLPMAARNPGLAVHSFEPSPKALAKLGTNAAANPGLANLQLYGVALSNEARLVPFFESHTDDCSGIGGLYAGTHNRAPTSVLVQSVSGDALIAQGVAPRPDLIKIDVEGWEPEVLEGLAGVLGDGRPLSVLWEHCLYRVDERHKPHDVILRMLEGKGFDVFACREGGELEPFTPAMLESDQNLLARRG